MPPVKMALYRRLAFLRLAYEEPFEVQEKALYLAIQSPTSGLVALTPLSTSQYRVSPRPGMTHLSADLTSRYSPLAGRAVEPPHTRIQTGSGDKSHSSVCAGRTRPSGLDMSCTLTSISFEPPPASTPNLRSVGFGCHDVGSCHDHWHRRVKCQSFGKNAEDDEGTWPRTKDQGRMSLAPTPILLPPLLLLPPQHR